jgi:hypothetical protein
LVPLVPWVPFDFFGSLRSLGSLGSLGSRGFRFKTQTSWIPRALVELAQSIEFEKFKPVMLAALRSLRLGTHGFRLSVMRPHIVWRTL